MAILKDSGERRDFGTGAFRDVTDGKGRCDLMPLGEVSILLDRKELFYIELFKKSKEIEYLNKAIIEFSSNEKIDIPTLILEVSKQFEDGAIKYGENNWKKGIPLHCYIDSAVRHYLKYIRGDDDEPHMRAFIWNIICGIWTHINTTMDDIEIPQIKEKKEDEK